MPAPHAPKPTTRTPLKEPLRERPPPPRPPPPYRRRRGHGPVRRRSSRRVRRDRRPDARPGRRPRPVDRPRHRHLEGRGTHRRPARVRDARQAHPPHARHPQPVRTPRLSAPDGLPGLHRRPPRPRPGPHRAARPAPRHPARGRRRSAPPPACRSPASSTTSTPAAPGAPHSARSSDERPPHALRLGAHRPHRRPRTRRPTVPMRRDARHRRLVASPAPGLGRTSRTATWSRSGRPASGKTVTNKVTDPYSTALTADSDAQPGRRPRRPEARPGRLVTLTKPAAVPLRRAQHPGTPDPRLLRRGPHLPPPGAVPRLHRPALGRHAAPGRPRRVRHLVRAPAARLRLRHRARAARRPGTSRLRPGLATPPTPTSQQDCVGKSPPSDAYNWGYDPLHYTVPEGSYASDPEGAARTVEFRADGPGPQRRRAAHRMDVVYNHTAAERPGPALRARPRSSPATTSGCSTTAASPPPPAAPTPRPNTR